MAKLQVSRLKRYTLGKIGVSSVLAVFFLMLLVYAFNRLQQVRARQHQLLAAQTANQVLGASTQNQNQTIPIQLQIPSINVDAVIENVGVNANGVMAVPSNNLNVGWFGPGTHPGETGSAVIAGHLDSPNGLAAVFSHLDKLKPGDKIYVKNATGTLLTFTVRASSTYDPGFAEEVFSRNDGRYLNLITCDGVWDAAQKSYNKRLVVFADLDD